MILKAFYFKWWLRNWHILYSEMLWWYVLHIFMVRLFGLPNRILHKWKAAAEKNKVLPWNLHLFTNSYVSYLVLYCFSSAADSASNSSVDGWEPQILTEVESSLDVAEVHQQHHIEDNFHFNEGHDVLRHPAQVICIKKVISSVKQELEWTFVP